MNAARVLMVLLCAAVPRALAADRPSQAEALALVFPNAELKRREYFLTEPQLAQVRQAASVDVKSKYLVVYEARRGSELLGVALFDTHVVRTAPETAMVAMSPAGALLRIEVVQFREPEEYAAPERWTKQFTGETLTPKLSLKGDIKPLSGASLTAQSLVDASRRALAFFEVLHLAGEAAAGASAPK